MDKNATTSLLCSRAWYGASVAEFVQSTDETVLGTLAANSAFVLLPTQRDAWIEQMQILRHCLAGLSGTVFFEFSIPRMGRRVDVVLLTGSVIFVLEFKVGEQDFDRAAIEQVWDYALDLKNFHEGSHAATLVPILVVTSATEVPVIALRADSDDVYRPVLVNSQGIRATIDLALRTIGGSSFNDAGWADSPYHPTPTIIEAARSLYAQHSVEAIARHDAGARNLRVTSRRLGELVDEARAKQRKIICLVTGVPGAGKTLVGLNVATQRREKDQPTHAVFLSGNGPLVLVLHEALTRDEVQRHKAQGKKVRKAEVREKMKAFIQNVHHFRDDSLDDPRAPFEHVVIFDEAQRAWNHKQTASFMHRKKKRPDFRHSEPEFLISCMDRHKDWAAVICLVGGGQEINTGEAGIAAWIDAVNRLFPDWHMYISSELHDSEYVAGKALESVRERKHTHIDDALHLSVSMRSFRAENVSHFVKSLLDCEDDLARDAFRQLAQRYPIVLTRNLTRAKRWVRDHARGSERFGMLASSKAQRLKPHAIDIRVDVDPVHWFLNQKEDTRSSFYLEDAATEFQVQGLELDWTLVNWDGDLRFNQTGWSYHDFRGAQWCNVNDAERRNYLKNAYRVLLTRARQGMAIFVPEGDRSDPTRSPAYYDSTFQYLSGIGIPVLIR